MKDYEVEVVVRFRYAVRAESGDAAEEVGWARGEAILADLRAGPLVGVDGEVDTAEATDWDGGP